MLVWGTKSVKNRIGTGTFYCPKCQTNRPYEHIRARRHGHLYWIPLIPMGEAVEYVECRFCHSTWQPSVLENAPADEGSFRDLVGVALLSTAVSVAAANGRIDAAEIEVVCSVVVTVTGNPVDRVAVESFAKRAGIEDLGIAERYLRRLEPALKAEGKEMIVQAALAVAVADGQMDEEEAGVVTRIANALGVSAAHLRGILASVAQRASA